MADSSSTPNGRAIVVVPTLNERDNITRLVPAILAQNASLSVLVVDDSSPDGTGEAVRALAASEPRVRLLSRPRPEGLGQAYRAGFARALEMGADFVIQMDADFSHPVAMLNTLLEEIATCDVVLGSRYVNGITVVNWPIERLLISYFGNWYARRIMGLATRDVTGGFRCWRRQVLERIGLERVVANGYAFQVEMTYRACRLGFRIREVPFIFADRTVGESKMHKGLAFEALWVVLWLRLQSLIGRL
jgi:dolichol-phosphate mannosyltransferase